MLDLQPEKRKELLEYLVPELELYLDRTREMKVTPVLDPLKVREAVRAFSMNDALEARQALEVVMNGLREHAVHTPHPMYYGLFNPRASTAGILADLLTAVFNPQLAAWSHSPYANEVEDYMVAYFGELFSYPKDQTDGVFAAGGMEANFTALLCALNHHFPGVAERGIRSLKKQPLLYCSSETHHSILKSAGMAGLGRESVRRVEVDERQRMIPEQLERMIREDRASGREAFLVVANAGTTGTGAIDPLPQIAGLCRKYSIWYHVDAAYGGACIMDPEMGKWIAGIEESDSLIVDLHKWFSVPMAASLFLTKDPGALDRTFSIRTDYMPGDARTLDITDPFSHSFQWSRRFTGLKIYLSLLLHGKSGLAGAIRQQAAMGRLLRELLGRNGWKVMNHTPLPVVCFTDPGLINEAEFVPSLCDAIVKSGEAWISVYPVGGSRCLRACITNFLSDEGDLETLVSLLDREREIWRGRQ